MKPTLLLLPGLMCDAAVWQPQVQALSATTHCVVIDYALRDSLTDMALLNRPDAAPVLPTITCLTLVLCGREDIWSPPEQHAHIAAAVAHARLCVVERCGHMATMERPDQVNAALLAWHLAPFVSSGLWPPP